MTEIAQQTHIETAPVDAPKPHLSASQLLKLTECGEFWRLRYIEKRSGPSSYRAASGIVVHEQIAASLKKRIADGEGTPVEAIPDLVGEAFDARMDSGNYLPDDPTATIEVGKAEQAKARDRAIGFALLHRMDVEPNIGEVIEVESRSRLKLDGFPFDLIVVKDIVTTDAIRDTKTTARSPSDKAADESLQLNLYAIHEEAMGRGSKRLVLDYLVATPTFWIGEAIGQPFTNHAQAVVGMYRTGKAPKLYYRPVETKLTPAKREMTLALIERAATVITKEAFMPNPASWLCSMKFCEFARAGSCRFFSGKE